MYMREVDYNLDPASQVERWKRPSYAIKNCIKRLALGGYMDYYNGSSCFSDLETKLKETIEKMELVKLIESNNIYHKVLINTLQSEIDELNLQITYHKNYTADILMYGCCGECCKNKNSFNTI